MILRAICTGWLLAGLSLGPAMAGPLDKPVDSKLSGEAIKAEWFNGQPFLATAPGETDSYKFTFLPDGKATKVAAGHKPARPAPPVLGFWRIIAEGYCIRWTGSVREKCYNVRKEGDVTVVRFGKVIVANWAR